MKTFETYEEVDGMAPCVKKPVAVHAKQIHEDFRVNTLEGDYKQGKAGDYLIKGVDGELYINDKDIFEKTYLFKLGDTYCPAWFRPIWLGGAKFISEGELRVSPAYRNLMKIFMCEDKRD